MATYPWWANLRANSLYHSVQPRPWVTSARPGNGPGPSGLARYAWIVSPWWPSMVMVSAIIPSYFSVVYDIAPSSEQSVAATSIASLD